MTALPTRIRSKRFVLLGLPLVAFAAMAAALLLPGLGSARTAIPGEPTISGSTTVGSTLTGTHGTWAPNAVTYKYNWRRCPPDGGQGGGNCDGIVNSAQSTRATNGSLRTSPKRSLCPGAQARSRRSSNLPIGIEFRLHLAARVLVT